MMVVVMVIVTVTAMVSRLGSGYGRDDASLASKIQCLFHNWPCLSEAVNGIV